MCQTRRQDVSPVMGKMILIGEESSKQSCCNSSGISKVEAKVKREVKEIREEVKVGGFKAFATIAENGGTGDRIAGF